MIRTLILAALVGAIQAHSQGALFSPAPGSPVVVGEGSGKLVLADVNGDGRLDLVTSHLLRRLVTVQIGDGTGRFAAAAGSPIVLGFQPGPRIAFHCERVGRILHAQPSSRGSQRRWEA